MGKKWKRVLLARRIAAAKEKRAEEVIVEKVAPVKVPPPPTTENIPLVTKTATTVGANPTTKNTKIK